MHLHLLIHGTQGHPRHLAEATRLFSARHPALHLVVPTSFTSSRTYDGIDWNAIRVVHELDNAILSLEKDGAARVTKLSVTGYSLGGLIARYAIGFALLLSIYRSAWHDFYHSSCWDTTLSAHFPHLILAWVDSSGTDWKELHLLDNWSDSGRPLLEAIAQPESVFYHSLLKFKNINTNSRVRINDVTVPYFSGAFEEIDPFANHRELDIIPEYIPDHEPLILRFSISKSSPSFTARLKSLQPLTFNGPFVEWGFPWNIILYLLLPFLIPMGVFYLAREYVLSSRPSRDRVRHLEQTEQTTPVPLPTAILDVDALPLNNSETTIMTSKQVAVGFATRMP
ncbi:hypothetical protein B0H16DRAFT_1720030 [Mycena metata]|uniref:DUF676 domain-containing protein n=1 Tax=Mycena metata TaxID=1033252 RepID=A0AAD7JA72_9AGAR|nr:hypothetical protein B0H16DRAFT_1720030 [Mycena metata]